MVGCEEFSEENPILGLIITDVDNLNQFGGYSLEVSLGILSLDNFNISQNVTYNLYSV